MKTAAALVACTLATASAFAPGATERPSTALNKSFFQNIAEMDLWAPISDSNDYGARGKKGLATGKLSDRSYVPQGLTKAQYEAVRAKDNQKRDANYQKNVSKAGKFLGFDQYYQRRGTDIGGAWMSDPNRGHTFAKTKYDWTGRKNEAPTYTGVEAK